LTAARRGKFYFIYFQASSYDFPLVFYFSVSDLASFRFLFLPRFILLGQKRVSALFPNTIRNSFGILITAIWLLLVGIWEF